MLYILLNPGQSKPLDVLEINFVINIFVIILEHVLSEVSLYMVKQVFQVKYNQWTRKRTKSRECSHKIFWSTTKRC